MPRLDLPEVDLNYQVHGEGAALTFVHGSGGNHMSFWQQVPLLSKRFRCITFDWRGYGLSRTAKPTERVAVLSDDLRALLDHLGVGRTHLVGQSIGGHIALRFALDHPDRVHGLVLADTLAGITSPDIAAALAAALIPDALLERALSAEFRGDRPTLTFLYQAIERLNHTNGSPAMPAPVAVDTAQLAALHTPILFVVGDRDPVAPPAAVKLAAAATPGAKFELIASSGHSAYFEQPAAFNRALTDFFAALA